MKRSNLSEKLCGQKKKDHEDHKRYLIIINVMGSAGPLRFVVNDDDIVASVIDTALKIYAREGRLPVLGTSHVTDFLLYSANSYSDALSPWEEIGGREGGTRKFVLCKKQRQAHMTEPRSQFVPKKTSGWKAWINKSFSFNILSH
ncbi:hypothetical protein M5689_007129 [Euphorbia peplus]|nr:hypothetical protein M5689_007129 [Euphorbia peplus]